MRRTQLQALLVIGALGAGLALVQLLGIAGSLVGVGLMAFSTVLSAPAAPEPGARGLNWWALLAGGTALALVGVPLGLVLEAPGGLLTAIGGGMAIVGVVFGYPT
ncbi:MAG TPA: hypothetical protein VHR38_10695 [Solirubrobacterales bacterium]|jgi:hypothetical protein|nr:hypothetical protein [Solirubrobacterales bacterium]